MRAGIYLLTSPSGKQYVGQSVNLKHRFQQYRSESCKCQTALYNAILKYGFDSFQVTILFEDDRDNVTKELLDSLEIRYIKEYNTLSPNGYNLTAGGEGLFNPTQEVRDKIGKAHKGKMQSEESRNKISNTLKEKYASGELTVKNKREIICYKDDNFFKEYNSIQDASNDLHILYTSISNILSGRAKKSKQGYSFKYKEGGQL